MDSDTTLIGLATSLAIFAFANWKSRQPRELGEISMIPWTAVQMIAMVAAMVFAAHMITILTGTPFKGRMGY